MCGGAAHARRASKRSAMAAARLLALTIGAQAVSQEQWNGPVGTAKCAWNEKWKTWTDNFGAGDRAVAMHSESFTCEGVDCAVAGAFSPKYSFSCATKGPGGAGVSTVLDPVVKYTMTGVTSEFHSEKPCKFLNEKVGPAPGPVVPAPNAIFYNSSDNESACPTHAGTEESGWEPWTCDSAHTFAGRDCEELHAQGANCSGCACFEAVRRLQVCAAPSADVCEYPAAPAGLTTLPHLENQVLDHWPGLLMDMGNLNGVQPHLNHEDWAPGEVFRHMLPYGIDGSVCDDSEYEGDAVVHERALYDGGVLIEKTRGPATTRSWMFKSDAHRAIAQADSRNAGLQYAKKFTGENGCDTEVVWEIEPKAGGGIHLELTVPLDARTCETEQGLRNAIAVWYTGEEVVVVVEKAALKKAQHLDDSCNADGYEELVRFASSFVCKATGDEVAAKVKFVNDKWDEFTVDMLSRDAENPTRYFTGTGVNYLNAGGRCVDGGMTYREHGAQFIITATALDAPESCGAFYWDPLLRSVPGDGTSWELQVKEVSDGDASVAHNLIANKAAAPRLLLTLALAAWALV